MIGKTTANGHITGQYQKYGLRALVFLCVPLIGLAQTGPANLGFEAGTPGQTPPGWSVPTAGYAAEIRHEGCKSGVGCAVLSLSAAGSTAPSGSIMQAFAADAFRGKTVRLRAWIHVEKTEAADRARMWLRVDRPGRQMGLFDNTRFITSSDWQSYEIAGDVEADAVIVNIGVMSYGKARVWIEDMSFEIRTATLGGTAAREEFQMLYAHINAAYESGDAEEIAAVALPDAETRSIGDRQPLSAVIAGVKASFAKGTRVSSKATVSDVQLFGDTAVVSTKTDAGFAFRRGQLRARGQTNGRLMDLALHDVPPAPEGSGDAVLSAAGMPLFFLDMSGVPADSRLGRWLAESHLHYHLGAVWQTGDAEANLRPERLSREYDGLIFVEEGHAARGLQGQR